MIASKLVRRDGALMRRIVHLLRRELRPAAALLGWLLVWTVGTPLLAQPNYSGRVTDAQGQPLEAVEILYDSGAPDVDQPWNSTLSDARGEFTLPPTLPDFNPQRGARYPFIAYKPGWAVQGDVRIDPAARRIQITLSAPASQTVRVFSPEGEPVAGANVRCSSLNLRDEWSHLPASLQRKLTFKTDAQGAFRSEISTAQHVANWVVQSTRYGHQSPNPRPAADGVELHLAPVGRIVGQVTADDPLAVRNLAVSLGSGPHFELRTDEMGRFEVAAHPVGELYVDVKLAPLSLYRMADFVLAELQPGETTQLKLELQKGMRVRGRVVDAKSKEPVAGVGVMAFGPGNPADVETDAQGWYEFAALPGEFEFSLFPPDGYFAPSDPPIMELSADQADVKPFQLRPGITVRGSVVDENDRPVAGALVVAAWQSKGDRDLRTSIATSSETGTFTLNQVEPDVQMQITATAKSRGSTQRYSIASNEAGHVVLPIRPAGVRQLMGRVVDAQRRPLVGVRVQVDRHAPYLPGEDQDAPNPFRDGFDDNLLGAPLITDADGMFRLPHPQPVLSTYSLKISGDGILPRDVPAQGIQLADDGTARLPDAIGSRVTTLRGRVLDQHGQPLEAAQVSAHSAHLYDDYTTTKTGRAGDFVLEDVHAEARFVFAAKDGYRFGGAQVVGAEQVVELWPLETKVPLAQRPHWQAWTRQQRRDFLSRFREPLGDMLNFSGDADDIALRVATYLPEFVQKNLDESFGNRKTNRAALLLSRGQVDEAIELLEQIDPKVAYRAGCGWFFLAADRADGVEEKLEILKRAARRSRQIEQPSARLAVLAEIVDRLIPLKQEALARQAVREGLVVAKSQPHQDREWFEHFQWYQAAVAFAAVDLQAARQLTAEYDEQDLEETYAKIALRIAGDDPEAAEKWLRKTDDYVRQRHLADICQRMAAVDLPRALRLLGEEENENVRADAMGGIARQRYKEHPTEARKLLRDAVLRPPAFYEIAGEAGGGFGGPGGGFGGPGGGFGLASGGFGGPFGSGPTAETASEYRFGSLARLVRIAEMVDPDSVNEYVWKAIQSHPGPRVKGTDADPYSQRLDIDRQNAQLAAFLALYDVSPQLVKELAAQVFANAAQYESRRIEQMSSLDAVYVSLAVADPEATAKLLESDLLRPQNSLSVDQKQVIQQWIQLYTADDDEFWDIVFGEIYR